MINTVCLCGSTRFLSLFQEANIQLSRHGLSIIAISMALPKNEQDSEDEAALKELLDLVHLNKIMRADAVYIVGDGYIGRSTAREIIWAEMQGKPVVCMTAGYSWEQEARCLKSAVVDTSVYARAREALGLNKKPRAA